MANDDLSKIPIFFILGRPRSGTTLLTTLFNAHPNVHIAPEFPIMLFLYQKFRNVKKWDEKQIRSFVDSVFYYAKYSQKRMENMKLDREAYYQELLKYKDTGNIQIFLKSINYHAYTVFEKGETLWIGDKNPVYSIYSGRLRKIFPEAKFICIIRDYRDNFISIKKLADKEVAVEAPNITLQTWRWRYTIKIFLKNRKKYPEKFFVFRYEDLVTDQEKTFRSLCEFLNISFDPSVFEFYQKREESMNVYGNKIYETFHENLLQPINTGRMNTWQDKLSEKQVRMADNIAGKVADDLGYERRYKKFSFWLYLKSLPMYFYNIFLFVIMVFGTYLPYKVSQWWFFNTMLLLKTYLFLFGKKSLYRKGVR